MRFSVSRSLFSFVRSTPRAADIPNAGTVFSLALLASCVSASVHTVSRRSHSQKAQHIRSLAAGQQLLAEHLSELNAKLLPYEQSINATIASIQLAVFGQKIDADIVRLLFPS
jgi:hypothetical protein